MPGVRERGEGDDGRAEREAQQCSGDRLCSIGPKCRPRGGEGEERRDAEAREKQRSQRHTPDGACLASADVAEHRRREDGTGYAQQREGERLGTLATPRGAYAEDRSEQDNRFKQDREPRRRHVGRGTDRAGDRRDPKEQREREEWATEDHARLVRVRERGIRMLCLGFIGRRKGVHDPEVAKE